MVLLYIDLNKDSPAFITCIKAVNKEKDLIEKIADVCIKNDKKSIFIWSNMKHVISYLEDVRKRSLFCWFYLIFDIVDKTTYDYDIKLLIKPALLPVARQAMDLYQKRFPHIDSKNYA